MYTVGWKGSSRNSACWELSKGISKIDNEDFMVIYHSALSLYIQPHLEYCVQAWSTVATSGEG